MTLQFVHQVLASAYFAVKYDGHRPVAQPALFLWGDLHLTMVEPRDASGRLSDLV